jgi:hypothetical protein
MHARRLRGVNRIFGAALHAGGVIIELEEVGCAPQLDSAEVVLVVRVVVLREIVEGPNRREQSGFRTYPQGI